MEEFKHRVIQLSNQLIIKGKPFSIESLRRILDGEDENMMTLLKVFDLHLGMMNKMKNKEYSPQTIVKYVNTRLRPLQYLRSKYKRKDFFLHELNYDFMKGFEVFLRERFNNCTVTVYKRYQRFKHLINVAIQKGYLDRSPFPDYKLHLPKRKIEYLTQAEVDLIAAKDFRLERLNMIRDTFVFCCYSGLGYAEVEKLSPDDLTVGVDGEKWMNIVRKRTWYCLFCQTRNTTGI